MTLPSPAYHNSVTMMIIQIQEDIIPWDVLFLFFEILLVFPIFPRLSVYDFFSLTGGAGRRRWSFHYRMGPCCGQEKGMIFIAQLNLAHKCMWSVSRKKSALTLVLLIRDMPGWTQICLAFSNSVDPDQLATEKKANWSGSALVVIQYINSYQQSGSSNLIGWQLEMGMAS